MKKLLSLVLILFTLNLAQPKPAHALVGLAFTAAGNPSGIAVAIVGGVITALGGVTWISAKPGMDGMLDRLFALMVGAVGVVILDDQQDRQIHFDRATADESALVGFTPGEFRDYNDCNDEINSVTQEIEASLQQARKPSVKLSAALWNKQSHLLEEAGCPDAFRALGKVSNHLQDSLLNAGRRN